MEDHADRQRGLDRDVRLRQEDVVDAGDELRDGGSGADLPVEEEWPDDFRCDEFKLLHRTGRGGRRRFLHGCGDELRGICDQRRG